jgi:hypothetical protein
MVNTPAGCVSVVNMFLRATHAAGDAVVRWTGIRGLFRQSKAVLAAEIACADATFDKVPGQGLVCSSLAQ